MEVGIGATSGSAPDPPALVPGNLGLLVAKLTLLSRLAWRRRQLDSMVSAPENRGAPGAGELELLTSSVQQALRL